MDAILVKVFATALALSQVTTKPDEVKTRFDPAQDSAAVVQLLRDGCAHFRKAFDLENIDLDDLISTAMSDPAKAGKVSGDREFRGINFDDLYVAYRQFCKGEAVNNSPIDIAAVIDFYNAAAADLPDHTKLKGMRLPGATFVLDAKGKNYAELYEPDSRRIWVPLSDVPAKVQAAFLAAEDRRFYQHHGVDERGVIRAFVDMLASSGGRRQGGSTITQQLAKNLLVGDEVSFQRKIREIIIASRIEHLLSKDEILGLYLNTIYFGRGSWGIEMASRSYFGKSAKDLSPAEGALLAGLVKGPNAFDPDKHAARAQARFAYVIERMKSAGSLEPAESDAAKISMPDVIPFQMPRQQSGRYFVDDVVREAVTAAGIKNLTTSSYVVHSTIRPDLQRATEEALQDGLARYEEDSGRAVFNGAETNLASAVRHYTDARSADGQPPWQRALVAAHLPLSDVQWTPAIIVDGASSKGVRGPVRVGLKSGEVVPLTASSAALRLLKLYDVVYVTLEEKPDRDGQIQIAAAKLRIRPSVQGAAVVIENTTGRILAMTGGFSYPLSQLNRATQARRQPGSALKPLSYLAALNAGMQPNTLVSDSEITLPPMQKSHSYRDYWHPRNYDGGSLGVVTLRRALENSRNRATAHLLLGIGDNPPSSLDQICALAVAARLYAQCERYYPFILGAEPVRPIDLAAFYAAIATEGALPQPYAIESIEQDGRVVYQHTAKPVQMTLADRPAFFQLKTMLQGVVARGTAVSMSELSPYVGGKTGTSDDWNDAWFVGFTNDVTIAVWVGYDNAGGKRRTLGPSQAGSRVAIPIFRPIVEYTWNHYAPQTALRGPSEEAQRHLKPELLSRNGEPTSSAGSGAIEEYLRTDDSGKIVQARYRLVGRAMSESASAEDDDDMRLPAPPAFARQEPRNGFNPFDIFGNLFGPPRMP